MKKIKKKQAWNAAKTLGSAASLTGAQRSQVQQKMLFGHISNLSSLSAIKSNDWVGISPIEKTQGMGKIYDLSVTCGKIKKETVTIA